MCRALSILTLTALLIGGLLGASGGKELCLHQGHIALEGEHDRHHGEDQGGPCTDWSIDSQRIDQPVHFDNTHHPLLDLPMFDAAPLICSPAAAARADHARPAESPPSHAPVLCLVLLI